MKYKPLAYLQCPIFRNALFFLWLILISPVISADDFGDIKIQSYSERTVIHSMDSGFTTYVTITGTSSGSTLYMPVILDPKNQILTDFSLYFKNKNNYKQVTDFNLFESPDVYSFYRSHVVKLLRFDEAVNFKCTYKIECKTMMLFGYINLCSFYSTDTAKYLVSLPVNLSIRYEPVNFDSLSFHKISYYTEKDSHYLALKVKPYRIDPENQTERFPFLRQIIVPANLANNEDKYFNDWYLANLDSLSVLNSSSRAIVDSLATNNHGRKDLVSLYYDYIRSRFKYLDIQIGMGAYIPRDVNTVFRNKQGDCKDLSNLLCSILRYKGFDANVAVAATVMHFCDFTFPSLASGDHVICTIKTDSLFTLLDPTDINHVIGQPVQSLQGKTIFITGKNGPLYYKVPVMDPDANNFKVYLNLSYQPKFMDGEFKVVLSGYTGNDLKWSVLNQGQSEVNQLFKTELQDIFHNQTLEDISWAIKGDSIVILGRIKFYNKCYLSGKLGYLYLDYLPCIFSNEFHKSKIKEKTLIGTTMHKTFKMVVNFADTICKTEFLPWKEFNENYSIDLYVARLNTKSLCVEYSFDYKKIWIEKTDIESLNGLITKFNDKSHETVVLHL
jgi:transglutaminase-like putative cysteine protease